MKTKKDQLIDCVLKEMENDIATGDFTAIEELLTFVPTKYLKGYLPEETESEPPIMGSFDKDGNTI